ncbi:MAG: GTPase [Winkia neuii]|uniref:GTPase n=1 Tax=Winkia neuii TaxID=33007 RepID=UPI00040E55E6|nr:GTPase [Winkia neuii]OFJ70200.1 hypothetical protein HMPREF2851_10690 [Actinomyces sp. HMSC064C12]OFT56356.1 hypothetical protein HMPREF3152_02255 [Actinomyces sp. HMSC06A08]KWZ72078.1 hypothetical protein HMPREF3198_02176 [Winkia neuii]MDK8099958.1 50S ribosome-binding GTPase [Winkia neuii]MDU3134969.1 GTPase [Winkia neuii]
MNLSEQIEHFDQAIARAGSLLPTAKQAAYRRWRESISGRVDAGLQTTVVAFLGATGSGKSSLFNAVAGAQIARAGATRPTTTEPLAALSGTGGATKVLDWLQVGRRVPVKSPNFPLDTVLLDLPDVDSYAVEHRQITASFASKVDVFVWVVDPQKYADATLHEGFVRTFAAHADVTIAVMTHIDQVPNSEREKLLAHARQVFASDGLSVPVLAVSTVTGEGVETLRRQIGELGAQKQAGSKRIAADLEQLRLELGETVGTGKVRSPLKQRDLRQVTEAAYRASGAKTVAEAAAGSYKHRGGMWTGWPVLSWIRRFRPDPLKRLRINAGNKVIGHSSVPQAHAVTSSDLARAVRRIGAQSTASLPPAYRSDMSQVVATLLPGLADPLDAALAKAEVEGDAVPLWWRFVAFLQTIFALVAALGIGWLAVNFVLKFFALEVTAPSYKGLPIPLELLGAGLLAGAITALLASLFVHTGALRAQRKAERKLQKAISQELLQSLADPVNARLDDYRKLTRLLSA